MGSRTRQSLRLAAQVAGFGLLGYDASLLAPSGPILSSSYLPPVLAILAASLVALVALAHSDRRQAVLAHMPVAVLIAVVVTVPAASVAGFPGYMLGWNVTLVGTHVLASVLLAAIVVIAWSDGSRVSNAAMLGLALAVMLVVALVARPPHGIVAGPFDAFRLRFARAFFPAGAVVFGLAVSLASEWLPRVRPTVSRPT